MPGLPADADVVTDELELAGCRVLLDRPADVGALIDLASDDVETPYWAVVWPSARALGRELAGRDLSGLRVLELGCGLALAGACAALAGARVVATDLDETALVFARRNLERAAPGATSVLRCDFTDPPAGLLAEGGFDLVIGADVLYEDDTDERLAKILPRLVAGGGEVLIAYPWREQATHLVQLMESEGWTTDTIETRADGWAAEPSPVWLLTLRQPGAA